MSIRQGGLVKRQEGHMMINKYREIENEYINIFSVHENCGGYDRFYDDMLPGMYAFNCIFIKDSSGGEICGLLADKLKEYEDRNQDFLKVLIHPEVMFTDEQKSEAAGMGFELKTNIYMRLSRYNNQRFEKREGCIVKRACTDEEFQHISMLDIKSSTEAGIPEDFAVDKAARKRDVYKSKDNSLEAYIAYFDGEPAGKCELFIQDGYAKIEDFDVIEKHQRKGIGTTMLRSMIEDAITGEAENIYLIADKDDTPRDMYSKLEFETIGEEIELFRAVNG